MELLFPITFVFGASTVKCAQLLKRVCNVRV